MGINIPHNRTIAFILPLHSRRRRVAKKALETGRNVFKKEKSTAYAQWVKQCEPALWRNETVFTNNPLISIVVPCYNTPKKYIDPLIESVLDQIYDNWELCLADGSQDGERAGYLKSFTRRDARIKYFSVSKEKQGIVVNTNVGLKKARGEFIAFLDHDDVLSRHALAEVAAVLNEQPKLDLIYSDEDKISDDGKERLLPFFKPDWSPELLLGVNYITHFVVARKSIVEQIGGLRKGFDGAQDYDFLLRFTEKTDKIYHIPKMLYHWRLAEGSTAGNVSEKHYADTAGQRALQDAVTRRGIDAEVVEIPERPTNYRLRYRLPKPPKVSIIIPFKDKGDLLKQCVTSILEKSTYKNYEILLLSNNSTEDVTHKYLKQLSAEKRCRIFYWDHPFNFSAINNFGVSKARGDYVVLLNNDTKVITPSWLEELVGAASQPGIGAVGPLLHYPDKRIQHAGVVVGIQGTAGHVFRFLQPESWTPYGIAAWPRNYLAVTAACLAIERKKYIDIGGLDERFIVAGQDVAFGIKLHEAGYRNVYWPFAELTHYENVSVGNYTGHQSDYDYSMEYYKPYLNGNDPYFNPNLDLSNEQIGIRSKQ